LNARLRGVRSFVGQVTVPGIVAHQCAAKNGKVMRIPQYTL
jgi:hypothetical protein